MAGQQDGSEDEFDPIASIIEDAKDVGLNLSETDVMRALSETGLDADEVSLNHPVLKVGKPLPPKEAT